MGEGNRRTDLGGEDGEVDAGEALEVLLEEALGVVLPDLLARHGDGEGEGSDFRPGRARCWTGRTGRWAGWSQALGVPACRVHVVRDGERTEASYIERVVDVGMKTVKTSISFTFTFF